MIIKSLLKVLVEKEMIWQRRNIVCKGKDSVNYVQLFSESHLTMTSFFITVYYFYVKKKRKSVEIERVVNCFIPKHCSLKSDVNVKKFLNKLILCKIKILFPQLRN